MAISATTLYEFNASATASNVNGGGFNYGNANFITNYAATSATGSSPVITSASYTFVAGDVGAWLYVSAGTSWTTGFYQISSVAGGAATINAAVGAAVQLTNGQWLPSTVAGCATVASPTSGTIGIDYSRGTAAIINGTDLACADGDAAAPTITSAGTPFGVNHVGNIISITAGTGYTAGYYEIVSVSGSTATLDRACGTDGAKTNGTFYVGGAWSSIADAVFEIPVAGNKYFIKSGTYSGGGNVAISAAGGASNPIVIEGYSTVRGDRPETTGRPSIDTGLITLGTSWVIRNVSLTGSGTHVLSLGTNCVASYVKAVNSSTTAARSGIIINQDASAISCEGVSIRGNAFSLASAVGSAINCYAHDSNNGFVCSSAASGFAIIGCISESNVTAAINLTAAQSANCYIIGCTLYGSEAKTGVGINIATGSTDLRVMNNIIYGFATGIDHADTQSIAYDDFNCFYNNTANVSATGEWPIGPNSIFSNPSFSNVTQETGTAATTASSILTDATANFANVVDNQDYCYLISGTGVTAGQYLITAHTATSITLSPAPGNDATADKAYQVTMGRNFAIGPNCRNVGTGASTPLSTNYLDIGALQGQAGTAVASS